MLHCEFYSFRMNLVSSWSFSFSIFHARLKCILEEEEAKFLKLLVSLGCTNVRDTQMRKGREKSGFRGHRMPEVGHYLPLKPDAGFTQPFVHLDFGRLPHSAVYINGSLWEARKKPIEINWKYRRW